MKKTITHGQQKILECNLIVIHGTASTYNSTLAIGGGSATLGSAQMVKNICSPHQSRFNRDGKNRQLLVAAKR